MKVIENSPDRLVLRRTSWLWGIVLIVMFIVMLLAARQEYLEGDVRDAAMVVFFTFLLPGLAFALLTRKDELILDRRKGLIELRHLTVFGGHKQKQAQLDRLEQASTQTSYQHGHKLHRVALILSGPHPKDILNITPVYTGGPWAKEAADTINAWLKSAG